MRYRVWVITNVPNESRVYEVASPEEGKRMIDAIANEHLKVPDNIIESNALGLQYFDELDGSWFEWENDDGENVDEAFE